MVKGQAVLFDALPVKDRPGREAVRGYVREMVIRYQVREDYQIMTGERIRSPEDIAKLFMPQMRNEADEVFMAIYLDGHHNVLHFAEIARGTPNQAVPHVRNILRAAIAGDDPAVSVACVHNHPSGNTTPSREDKRFTQALKEGCEALEVKLIDHIITGENSFFSFAEAGAI